MYVISDNPKSDYYIWNTLLQGHPDFTHVFNEYRRHKQSGYLLDISDNLVYALMFCVVYRHTGYTSHHRVKALISAITGEK
jgi:hypothetical protein